ncbi:hypothetical protein M1N59_01380 [Dehalococcoidales bacterium]|nr:hypothetical protein [Dehalococcoidales bacterium]
MIKLIAYELVRHIPFTALGATTGIVIMVIMVLANVPAPISYTIFYILHPLHLLLSAVATTAMFVRHSKGKVWAAILIGYVGSIGIATLSDALIPYLGGALVGIKIEFHIPLLRNGG